MWGWKGILVSLCTLVVCKGAGADFTPESVGLRWGFGTGSNRHFDQTEAFADWLLPWETRSDSGWKLGLLLQFSAGVLWEDNRTGAIGTVGPLLRLEHRSVPLFVEGGLSPTVLAHSNFESKQLGGPLEFTSHVGVGWDFTEHFRLGYRFQHMSNAGLSHWNPGLNLHIIALSYKF